MKFIKHILVVILYIQFAFVNAQTTDSLKTKLEFKTYLIPITFIGAGVLLTYSQFEQDLQLNLRNSVGHDFDFPIDEFTPYVPIAEMYIADMAKIESKNHWFDQTKYLFISNVITSVITQGLKRVIVKTRPNGLPHSMPSGHTAVAFVNATVLFNEFQHTAPVLAYSGYAFAATTGTFRMLNNQHYLSDVLVSAGLAMVVTKLVYHFEPLKSFNPFKKTKNISFFPQIQDDFYGFYFCYRL